MNFSLLNDKYNALSHQNAMIRYRCKLSIVPKNFDTKQAAALWGISYNNAAALIRQMVHYNLVKAISEYKTPRVYQKVES